MYPPCYHPLANGDIVRFFAVVTIWVLEVTQAFSSSRTYQVKQTQRMINKQGKLCWNREVLGYQGDCPPKTGIGMIQKCLKGSKDVEVPQMLM